MSGLPDCGSTEGRSEAGWKDPKGRSPSNYLKVMRKEGYTKEELISNASKKGIILKKEDLEEQDVKEKKQGRKSKVEVDEEVSAMNDIFASMTIDAKKVEYKSVNEAEKQKKVEKKWQPSFGCHLSILGFYSFFAASSTSALCSAGLTFSNTLAIRPFESIKKVVLITPSYSRP